jgi:hypothetical protein
MIEFLKSIACVASIDKAANEIRITIQFVFKSFVVKIINETVVNVTN